MNQLTCCVLTVFAIPLAMAQGAQNYRCTIERVVIASKFGAVLQAAPSLIGQQFTVERRTGIMAGALKNSYITTPQVIDTGSSENSFKAVTTLRKEQGAGEGSNVYVLVVNEFETSASKSFVFLENDHVYFGNCIHL